MPSGNVAEQDAVEPAVAVSVKAVDDQLIDQPIDELVSRSQGRGPRAGGLQPTGEGGLQQLAKRLPESALEGGITDRLGYDKHDPAGRNGGNSRNGTRSKTALTDVGPVEITMPRDHDGSFKPKSVKKRQKRPTGIDERGIPPTAKNLTTGKASVMTCEYANSVRTGASPGGIIGVVGWCCRIVTVVGPAWSVVRSGSAAAVNRKHGAGSGGAAPTDAESSRR